MLRKLAFCRQFIMHYLYSSICCKQCGYFDLCLVAGKAHLKNCICWDLAPYKLAESDNTFRRNVLSPFQCEGKGKVVPLQSWSGPEGSRKLRLRDFMTTAQDGGKFVSLKHRPPLSLWKAPGTHFCQKLSRSQGHSAIGMKNSNDTS